MHRYHTRFQARQPQVRVNDTPFYPKEDVDFLTDRLNHSDTLKGMGEKTKITLEIFSYLAIHQALLHHPSFRTTVINTIAKIRNQLENNKTNAINTFVLVYSPHENSCLDHKRLMDARDVLGYAPLLEVEFKKVEAVMYQ